VTIAAAVIGRATPPTVVAVERGRIRLFAEAIGERDPIFTDPDAARVAGHPDLPVPPTLLYGLHLDGPDPFRWMTDLGIDLRFVLHASQRFDYHGTAYAGDELVFAPTVTDVYAKRGGALEFVVRTIEVTRGAEPIATLTETIVVRHPERDELG
jgi:acyl dehydratase